MIKFEEKKFRINLTIYNMWLVICTENDTNPILLEKQNFGRVFDLPCHSSSPGVLEIKISNFNNKTPGDF